MKVFMHNDFYNQYVFEPAASPGRMEAVVSAIRDEVEFEEAFPAGQDDLAAVHTKSHIESIIRNGLFNISALAAGGAIQAAELGLSEPAFGLVRPPGHHASSNSCWGFCYFNNMAVALEHLRREGKIKTAYILDFDLHYGDGTVNILKDRGFVAIHNPDDNNRERYLDSVRYELSRAEVDIIGVSAGFDNHRLDWGGLLTTEDYQTMGRMVHDRAKEIGAGCFGILEGGYNHDVLGFNVRAFLRGLRGE